MASTRAIAAAEEPASTASVLVAFAVIVLTLGYVYRDTLESLVSVWTQTETFAHCFLVAPISAFLVWRRRHELAAAPQRVSVLGIGAVAALAVAWLVASAANVQFGQQFALVMLIPGIVVALIGVEAARQVALPLAYLVFAVPFGEVLVPILMDVTAAFAVASLQLTGIPVVREGFFFSIPSGDFEVAKTCSGIRYLIACLALGVLYAHLSYRSWQKRAIFIAVSLVATIIANGIRAYLIVMIAHLSGMKLAVGVDHLIYGWIFFAGLVALMFWIGNFFLDADAPLSPSSLTHVSAVPRGSRASLALTAAAIVAVAAVGPHLLMELRARDTGRPTAVAESLPVLSTGDWQGPEPAPVAWYQSLPNIDRSTRGVYTKATTDVEVDVLQFGAQRQDAEMVGSLDKIVDRNRWQILDRGHFKFTVEGEERVLAETVLRSGHTVRVLWHWYNVGGTDFPRDWQAKLAEAWGFLQSGRSDSRLMIASTESIDLVAARAALRSFFEAAGGRLLECREAGSSSCVASR